MTRLPKSQRENNQGVVILYAVIITTTLALVGLALSNIIARQAILSGLEEGSQKAYYAAHTGYQCLLALNTNLGGYSGVLFGDDPLAPAPTKASCDGVDFADDQIRPGQTSYRGATYDCRKIDSDISFDDHTYHITAVVTQGESGIHYYSILGNNSSGASPSNRQVEKYIVDGTDQPLLTCD